MFDWYQNADVCLVYLQDVDSSLDPAAPAITPGSLRASDWFTRGWTLQELVAPLVVSFHGGDWRSIGSRAQLGPILSEVTGIDADFFETSYLSRYSVAQKMSWAAARKTTRIEDQAYCLMGLFDIKMPLLYGEGSKAFQRLQEEILRRSIDYSIFVTPLHGDYNSDSVLSRSPAAFSRTNNVTQVDFDTQKSLLAESTVVDHGASITSRGIVVTLAFLENLSTMPGKPSALGSLHLAFESDRDRQRDYAESRGLQVALLNCYIGPGNMAAMVLFEYYGLYYKHCVVIVDKSMINNAQPRTIVLSTNQPERKFNSPYPRGFRWTSYPVRVQFPDPVVSGFALHKSVLNTWETQSLSTTEVTLVSTAQTFQTSHRQCLCFGLERPELASPHNLHEEGSGFALVLVPNLHLLLAALIPLPSDNFNVESFREPIGEYIKTTQPRGDGNVLIEALVRRGPGCWTVSISIRELPYVDNMLIEGSKCCPSESAARGSMVAVSLGTAGRC